MNVYGHATKKTINWPWGLVQVAKDSDRDVGSSMFKSQQVQKIK